MTEKPISTTMTTFGTDQPDDFSKMNVYQKIHWVQSNITNVEMTGFNSYSSYAYATATDIIGVVQPLLNKARLATSFDYDDKTITEEGIVQVHGAFKIINIDNPEEVVETRLWGEGKDVTKQGGRGDKGFYQAYTGFHKYALLRAFNIPTGDHDPECDNRNPPRDKKPPVTRKSSLNRNRSRSTKSAPPPNKAQDPVKKDTPAQMAVIISHVWKADSDRKLAAMKDRFKELCEKFPDDYTDSDKKRFNDAIRKMEQSLGLTDSDPEEV